MKITLFLFLLIGICFNWRISESSDLPKYAYLFTDFYSKNVKKTIQQQTSDCFADTNHLNPLVKKFDDYVKEKGSAKIGLVEELLNIFETSHKLLTYWNQEPKKNHDPKEIVVRNLADLLITVKLAESNHIIEEASKLRNKLESKLVETSMQVIDIVKITFHSSDGFTLPVVNVLLEKTAPLRKKKQPKVVNFVKKIKDEHGITFVVRREEIVDEIVWLCVVRNCVSRSLILEQGGKNDKVKSEYRETEEAFIALYIARVKVLLYLVLFQPQFEKNQTESFANKTKLFGPKCLTITGITGAVVLSLLGAGFILYKNYSPSSGVSVKTPPPVKIVPTTEGWAAIFTSPLTLSCIAALLVVGGAYYYYHYHYHWSDTDEEEEENRANFEKEDNAEVDERGKKTLKETDKKSRLGAPASKQQRTGQKSVVGSTVLSMAKMKASRRKGTPESGVEQGEKRTILTQKRTFSSVFNLNKSVDLTKFKLLSSLVEEDDQVKKNKVKQGKQVKIQSKVVVVATDEQPQSDSTIVTTRDVQRGEPVLIMGKPGKTKAKQQQQQQSPLEQKKEAANRKKKKKSPPPAAIRLASSIATNQSSFAAVSEEVPRKGKQQQPAHRRTPSSLIPSSTSEEAGEAESPGVHQRSSASSVEEHNDYGKRGTGVPFPKQRSTSARPMATNVPPFPSTAASSAAAAAAAAAAGSSTAATSTTTPSSSL